MSRKNRYKFRDRPAVNTAGSDSHLSTSVSGSSVSADRSAGAMAAHADEYKIITRDLLRLIILNGVMLGAVLALYFANRDSLFLERWFQNLF